jgi:hypothetical protein
MQQIRHCCKQQSGAPTIGSLARKHKQAAANSIAHGPGVHQLLGVVEELLCHKISGSFGIAAVRYHAHFPL